MELLNHSYDSLLVNRGKGALPGLLTELLEYARYHFSAEEKLMNDHDYPGLKSHVKEHLDFTRQIVEFDRKYQSGDASFSVDLMILLRDWLLAHILQIDKKCVAYLHKNGVV